MADRVSIEVGGRELTVYKAYSADSNLLIPADEFSVTVPGARPEFKTGDRFNLKVNGHQEMNGIIEKRELHTGAAGNETTLSGRDLMGLAVDGCLDKAHWKTKANVQLKPLAASLLSTLPYLKDRKPVFMHELADTGVSGRKSVLKKSTPSGLAAELTSAFADEQFSAGTTVFDALADRAQRHGLLLWMAPDGTLVFGRPIGAEVAAAYHFYLYEKPSSIVENAAAHNNVLSVALTDDLSKRYSKITVVGQREGSEFISADGHDIYEPEKDGTFPYSSKHLVIQRECKTPQEARQLAKIEMQKRIAASWRLKLDVIGHSQDGNNYRANEACEAVIEPHGVTGKFIVLGRRFIYSEADGQKTALELGKITEGYVAQ